jgi:hypothetical protein
MAGTRDEFVAEFMVIRITLTGSLRAPLLAFEFDNSHKLWDRAGFGPCRASESPLDLSFHATPAVDAGGAQLRAMQRFAAQRHDDGSAGGAER